MDLSRGATRTLTIMVRDPQPDGTMKTIRTVQVTQEIGPDGEPQGPCVEEEIPNDN